MTLCVFYEAIIDSILINNDDYNDILNYIKETKNFEILEFMNDKHKKYLSNYF